MAAKRTTLTPWQAEFLHTLLNLQTEEQDESVHYSVVAERIGVTKMSAYEMMRVLKQKGCVDTQYRLPEARNSRSGVYFCVTQQGLRLLNTVEVDNRWRF